MTDATPSPSAIETPCVGVCVIEPAREDPADAVCLGCGRTRMEIARWLSMTDEERRDRMAGLPARLEAALTRLREAAATNASAGVGDRQEPPA